MASSIWETTVMVSCHHKYRFYKQEIKLQKCQFSKSWPRKDERVGGNNIGLELNDKFRKTKIMITVLTIAFIEFVLWF